MRTSAFSTVMLWLSLTTGLAVICTKLSLKELPETLLKELAPGSAQAGGGLAQTPPGAGLGLEGKRRGLASTGGHCAGRAQPRWLISPSAGSAVSAAARDFGQHNLLEINYICFC